MHELNSARFKAERANIHINALKRSVNRLFNPQSAIREQAISQGPLKGLGLITIDIDPSLRAKTWGLIIGDIVTNLRASLDHIAWALVMFHVAKTKKRLSPKEKRAIIFPLLDDPAGWPDPGKKGSPIEFVSRPAHFQVERFQPYNRRDWPELNLLRDLQLLVNADKHRVVTPTNVRAHIRLNPNDPGIIAYLNDKSNHQFLNTGLNLEPNITFEIAVYPRDPIHPMNINSLSLIHDFIRDEVIPSFTGFFK
jgi:hypothetical protein